MTTPPTPQLYAISLTTGEITGGPPDNIVQHCNSRTGYEMIIHPYAPAECSHCSEIAEMLS